MGTFYGTKIKDSEVNTKTGEAWKMEDVPVYWRAKTADWLQKECTYEK